MAWSQDASGRTTYTFDADGNQQVVLSPSGDRVTNVWDYENKLVGVQHPAGSRETMAYDPDGKRVMLQETAATTKYVWDDQNYLQETDASDVTQVTYTNEPRTYGNLISQRRSSANHYYLFDALGSTRLLTDASEAVSESLLYDAWGNLVGSAPTLAVPFRWVGELGYLFVSVTSDYYVRARVYQPGIGRWISRNPLSYDDARYNLYVYSTNHSIIVVDPSGLQDEMPEPPPTLPHSFVCPSQLVDIETLYRHEILAGLAIRGRLFNPDNFIPPPIGVIEESITSVRGSVPTRKPCGDSTTRLSLCSLIVTDDPIKPFPWQMPPDSKRLPGLFPGRLGPSIDPLDHSLFRLGEAALWCKSLAMVVDPFPPMFQQGRLIPACEEFLKIMQAHRRRGVDVYERERERFYRALVRSSGLNAMVWTSSISHNCRTGTCKIYESFDYEGDFYSVREMASANMVIAVPVKCKRRISKSIGCCSDCPPAMPKT